MSGAELQSVLPATSTDGRARAAALDAVTAHDFDAFVTYASAGRLLVLGPLEAATAAARRLRSELDVRVLATDPADERLHRPDVEDFGPRLLRARVTGVEGHLGAFRIAVVDGDTIADLGACFGLGAEERFDLVLDLGTPPALRREKLPPGYFAPADDEELAQALTALPELVGEFDKPRYFDYDPSICVHGNRGQSGCSRCLDHCATEAIRSVGERIEVDPFLCQGCGSCATVCPTGAIGYTAPAGETLVDDLRGLLRRYREAGGQRPAILFHDAEAGASALEQWSRAMPESILPVQVEDTGGVGPDAWLAALAYGAGRILLAVPAGTPASERAASAGQLTIVRELLAGLGLPSDRVALVDVGTDETLLAEAPAPLVAEPATFAALGGKRARLRRAIEHLYRQTGTDAAVRPLPAGAPLGGIEVDTEACTLCMACVSVCPTQALEGGGDAAALGLREDRCVQCGICERACPEDAIRLAPRLDFAAQTEPASRTLHRAEMHHCPGCGKAFAPRKVIERMEDRLAGHWMFTDDAARQRLRLCEDCRVKAVLRDEGGINPYQ